MLIKDKLYLSRFANKHKRFLAYGIDIALVTMLRYIVFILLYFSWLEKKHLGFFQDMNAVDEKSALWSNQQILDFFLNHQFSSDVFIVCFIVFITGSCYWIFMPISKIKNSFGKKLMKIVIAKQDDSVFSGKDSLVRYLVGLLPWCFILVSFLSLLAKKYIACLIAGTAMTLWYEPSIRRKHRYAIHDMICATIVTDKN